MAFSEIAPILFMIAVVLAIAWDRSRPPKVRADKPTHPYSVSGIDAAILAGRIALHIAVFSIGVYILVRFVKWAWA